MRIVKTALAGLAFAAVVAAPAAAVTVDRWTDDPVADRVYSCGAEERTSIHIDGADYFDADGNWSWASLRFRYDTTLTDPATGKVVTGEGRQVLTVRAGEIQSRGQGFFIRVPVEGVVLLDVGRLVFNSATGETLFQSASVLPFDEAATAATDAAVCSLFD
jgi:hypothetical protein